MARAGGHERSRSATGLNHPADLNFSWKSDDRLVANRSIRGLADWAQYFAHARASGPILRQA